MNKTGLAVAGTVLAAVAGGAYWMGRWQAQVTDGNMVHLQAQAPAPGREILFYRHPMNPSVTSPVPAKDEMGMDYVPVYAGSDSDTVPGTVSIDPTIVQSIGVRTEPAERRTMTRRIRTVGRVDYDEKGLVRVHLRSEGWVEKLFVAETGQPVRAGEPLLSLYAPQIVSAEQEYQLARHGVETLGQHALPEIAAQARALLASSAQRLRLLGVPEGELLRLQRGGDVRRQITLTAPASGIVQRIGVREGQFVSPQTEAFHIADLSTVWVLVDLYEDDVPWVRVGDRAQLRLRGMPGENITARVDYVYPYLEGRTRTQKVRLRLDNRDGRLRPDMFADVTLDAGRAVEAVTVPDAAIVRSGVRALVFVQIAPGRFEPREVTLGVAADGRVQILEGVAEGEAVVVSAQFLIDSESKLREAVAKLAPPSPAPSGSTHVHPE